MPEVGRRCRVGRIGRNIVAAWLALLLAIAPFGSGGPVHDRGASLSFHVSRAHDDIVGQTREPIAASRSSQSIVLGVLSRLLTGEGKPGLPPHESVVVNGGWEDALAAGAAPLPTARPLGIPLRSALEAAHPPTGPPA